MSELELLVGERQSGESDNAVIACNDYLRMGPGRSLAKLVERYQSAPEESPTRRLATLKGWSTRFGWQERAAAFNAAWEELKNAERQRVMNEGLALDFERVIELKELALFLKGQIFEQNSDGVYHNVWVPDVKVVGAGEYAETVDIERFNAALIREFRETLADLAAETGGRVKRQDITGHMTWADIVDQAEPDDDDPFA